MNNVIQLLVRYGAHLLFIVLEVICFNLIINYNKTQREVFLNSSNLYAGKISEQKARLSQFVSLRDVNDSLMFQNANLMEQLITIDYKNDRIPAADSLLTEQYKLIPATVCNSTIHLLNNHITLCKGSRKVSEKIWASFLPIRV